MENELDGYIIDQATYDSIVAADELLQKAMGGDAASLARRFLRLVRGNKYAAALDLCEPVDMQLVRQALQAQARAMENARWYVAGVEVPREVEQQLTSAPRRQKKSMLAGIEAALRGLASLHPRLGRVLENAAARREEGKTFAEASREVRDRNYRERVEWVAAKYQEVRGKYGEGDSGDKAARLEVATLYARLTGKKRMHDRTVCNHLNAASRADFAAAGRIAE
jgi:hypothetical protein